MPHLFVFDLDGTLVDSRLDLAGSANRLLAELDAAPLSVDQVGSMVGEGARVLVSRVLAAAGVDTPLDEALARFLDIYDRHLLDHTRLYPGVLDALDALHGVAVLAVLTNKPGRHSERLLEALGIRRYFVTVVGGDAAPWARKPDPSSLRHLMASAGTSAATTTMVGDSMVDVETARRAPTGLCIAQYGFGEVPEREVGDALVASSPGDLRAVLLGAMRSGPGSAGHSVVV